MKRAGQAGGRALEDHAHYKTVDERGYNGHYGTAGGANAFDFTQASRKSFRFGERNTPSIPGLSAR